MSSRSPCYKFSPLVNGGHDLVHYLRVELSANCFYLLAYHHLDLAKFESADGRDTLTLSFLNRQVRIIGTNLRELSAGFQARFVDSIIVLPKRYAGTPECEAGFIESIEVEETALQS